MSIGQRARSARVLSYQFPVCRSAGLRLTARVHYNEPGDMGSTLDVGSVESDTANCRPTPIRLARQSAILNLQSRMPMWMAGETPLARQESLVGSPGLLVSGLARSLIRELL